MDEMTVLHVADYGGTYKGSFIAALQFLGESLARRGGRQIIALSDIAADKAWLPEVRAAGHDVRLLPSNLPILQQARRIRAIVRDEKVDIVHTHFTTFDVAASLVGMLPTGRGHPTRVFWHVHSPWHRSSRTLRGTLRDTIKYRLLSRTAWTLVVSHGGMTTMRERGLNRHRSRVVENGIDTQRLVRDAALRRRVRRDLGLDDGDVACLLYGWTPGRKGVDLAMAAVEELRRTGVPAVLLVVGGDETKLAIDALSGGEARAWVQLVPPTDAIAEYLNASDVFVSASRSEGFSYAVAEALAFGLPVVTSRIRGLEWAEQMPAAVGFVSEDAHGLAQALRDVLEWPMEERRARADTSRQRVVASYALEAWAERMIDAYAWARSA